MRCFFCEGKLEERAVVLDVKWGNRVKTVNATVRYCDDCDRGTFDYGEAKRLQDIAREE